MKEANERAREKKKSSLLKDDANCTEARERASARRENENVLGEDERSSGQPKYEKKLYHSISFLALALSSDFSVVFLLMTNEEEEDVVKWK